MSVSEVCQWWSVICYCGVSLMDIVIASGLLVMMACQFQWHVSNHGV